MQLFRRRDTLDLLEDLLDRERAAILGARFDLLERLFLEKQRLLPVLVHTQPANRLSRLRRKADHNQSMLLAASRGIKSVADRFTQLLGQQFSLNTYDSAGQVRTQTTGGGRLTRRA